MNIGAIVGMTLDKVEHKTYEYGNDEIVFTGKFGCYRLYHDQECCENVNVEEIIGDLDDLVGRPILRASEDTNQSNDPGPLDEDDDSYTWTFYNISTIKGTVTIRWYGTSNGYYSEKVTFERIEDK